MSWHLSVLLRQTQVVTLFSKAPGGLSWILQQATAVTEQPYHLWDKKFLHCIMNTTGTGLWEPWKQTHMVEPCNYLLFCRGPFIRNIFDPLDVLHSPKYTKMDLVYSLYFLWLTHMHLSDGHWEWWGKWKMLPDYTTVITAAAIEEYSNLHHVISL